MYQRYRTRGNPDKSHFKTPYRIHTFATMDSIPQPIRHLANTLDRDALQRRLDSETFSRKTVSFYRYVYLDNPTRVRDQLYLQWEALGCLGRIYVAKEGINAQMNVPEHQWDQFKTQLYAWPEFHNVPFKMAVEDDGKSFLKLQVKARPHILADGLPLGSYDVSDVGRHLTAQEWNELMERPDAVVVDIRNHYESEIGHFENALIPQAETFREELPEVLEMLQGKEEATVLLYCTGGIRCEKTSSFLKHYGFKNVNQLHGGIIDYARQIQELGIGNKFHGKNFVFDERLGESISDEVISQCHQCGSPADKHTNCTNTACNVLFIQCDHCKATREGTCSSLCQEIVHLPEKERLELQKQSAREASGNAKRFARKVLHGVAAPEKSSI